MVGHRSVTRRNRGGRERPSRRGWDGSDPGCSRGPPCRCCKAYGGIVSVHAWFEGPRYEEIGLELTRESLAGALEAAGVGTWQWDIHPDVLTWDAVLGQLLGLSDEAFRGGFDDLVAVVHPDDRGSSVAAIERAVADGSDFRTECRVLHPDGEVRWIEFRGQAVTDEGGAVVGTHGVGFDISDRRERQARQDRLRLEQSRARKRLAFLAEVSETLAQSLDVHASLDRLARLAADELADWALVSLLEGGHLRPVAIAHADPAKGQLAQRMLDDHARPSELASLKVLRTGRTEVLNEIDDDLAHALATTPERLEALRALGLGSILVVPLARGTMLGTMTMVREAGAPPFDEVDVTLVDGLARRASVALDNARLYGEQHRLADALQRTLLPPRLPEIPGADVAARYRPASAATNIGGDFYDLFESIHDHWTVLVGDVRGKGPEAAALTGLTRHAARAAALRDDDPTEILAVVNEALMGQDPDEGFCTAVCANLRVHGDSVTVAVAGGGHPPALVLHANGEVTELPSEGLLLGLFPDPGCRTTTVELVAGDTLVLYTDGVTEARSRDEEYGLARLRALLSSLVDTKPDDLVSRILHDVEAFQDPHHRDDIAVLALSPSQRSPAPSS